MRYDAEHKLKTRERVLKIAAREIRADGPHRIGVAAIMGKAGLTHGGFYAHFASKEELISAAIGEMFASGARRFFKETEGRSPPEGLVAYIDFYLSPQHRDAQPEGCPIAALAADVPRMTGASRAAFAKGADGLRSKLASLLQSAGYAEPEALASSMLSELVGALSLARIEADARLSDSILAASRLALKQRLQLEPTP